MTKGPESDPLTCVNAAGHGMPIVAFFITGGTGRHVGRNGHRGAGSHKNLRLAIVTGAEATITGWRGPDFAARVKRVEPGATTRFSALGIEEQRVDMRLALVAAPPPTLGHGFRVSARIKTDNAEDIIRVPIAALFRSGGDWAVYTAQDGKAALGLVSLGRRNDELAEVPGGLDEKTAVILHPGDTPEDGTRIADQPWQRPNPLGRKHLPVPSVG